jgi:nucleoid-associated protein YgaU
VGTALLVAATAVVLLGHAARGGAVPEGRHEGAPVHRYVVRHGDTLWEIARRIVGPEGDPRPVIESIERANGLGGALIVSGQVLLLPAAP